MNWLNKLERKFGKYAIHNLMYYITILYVIGFVLSISASDFYQYNMTLDAKAILNGQIWRLFTFLMYPPSSSPIFVLFALYLYYMIGTNLERQWGAFRFNFYILTGILGHIIAAFLAYFITGISFPLSTNYINLSLFFAFAVLYPNVEFMLFFILPVKVKYLAYANALYFAITILKGILPVSLTGFNYNMALLARASAIAAFVSVLNFLVYFFATRNMKRISPKEVKRKRKFKREMRQMEGTTKHKCAICGRTEEDGEELEFRFCSKCDGNYEYCQDHLFTHNHVKKK